MTDLRLQFGHHVNLRETSGAPGPEGGRIRPPRTGMDRCAGPRQGGQPARGAFTGMNASSSIVGWGYFQSAPSKGTYMPSGVSARK